MIAMITIVINPPQWIADTPPQEVGWLRELESQDISLYVHYCSRRNSSLCMGDTGEERLDNMKQSPEFTTPPATFAVLVNVQRSTNNISRSRYLSKHVPSVAKLDPNCVT